MSACPFCGSTHCDATSDPDKLVVRIVCLSCNAQGPPGFGTNYTDSARIAKQRWKNRKVQHARKPKEKIQTPDVQSPAPVEEETRDAG